MPRIEIPASGGIREDIDDRVKQPGQWARLENADVTVLGRFRRRRGFAIQVDIGAGAAVTASVSHMSAYPQSWALLDHSQLVMSGTRGDSLEVPRGASLLGAVVHSRQVSVDGQTWESPSSLLTTAPAVCTGTATTSAPGATNIPALVASVLPTAPTVVVLTLVDALTGDTLGTSSYTAAGSVSGLGVTYLRTDVDDSVWCVSWYLSGSTSLVLCEVAASTLAVSSVVTITTLSQPHYAACFVDGGTVAVAYWVGTEVRWRTYSSGALGTATVIAVGAALWHGIDIAANLARTHVAVAYCVPASNDCAVSEWTLAGALAGTSTVSPANEVTRVRLCSGGLLGTAYTLWTGQVSGTAYSTRVYRVTPSAGTSSGVATVANSVPYSSSQRLPGQYSSGIDTVSACGLLLHPEPAIVVSPTADSEFAVFDEFLNVHFRSSFGLACTTVAADVQTVPGGLVFPDLTAEVGPTGFAVAPPLSSAYSDLSATKSLVYVGEAARFVSGALVAGKRGRSVAQLGSLGIAGGGLVRMWDQLSGLPFPTPDVPTVSATTSGAGGSLAAGTYGIAVTYEWRDSQGRLYQGAPALTSIVTTGATSTITVTAGGVADGNGGTSGFYSVSWAVWITEPNGEIYYRQLTNDRGASYPVSSSDYVATTASLLTVSDTLYTVAEPPRLTPYPAAAVGAAASRLWAADGCRLYYSHQPDAFNGPQFAAGSFYLTLPDEVVAIGELDETPIVLTRSGAYRVVGDGPDRTGGGGQFLPQRIGAAQGCVDPRSVVTSSEGLWWQSRESIEFLARGSSATESRGHQLQATLETYPYVVGATEDPTEDRVVFALSSSPMGATVVLAVWTTGQGWSLWTPGSVTAVGSLSGQLAVGGTGKAAVSRYVTDATDDITGSPVAVTMLAQTGDLRPQGAAAPGQWGAVSLLTGQRNATSTTVTTAIRADSDAGSVTQASQSTTVDADRQRVRVAPQYGSADALQVTWSTSGATDLLGATIEYDPQPGTTRVPSARSR